MGFTAVFCTRKSGLFTYITNDNIAIDNVVYTFNANSVMYNAAGTVVATGGTNINVLLDQGDVVEDVVVDGGVVKSLKLKTDISVEAAAVEALIAAFTDTGTQAQVTAARTAYDALNSYGKAIVDAAATNNTAKLVLGEDTLAAAAFSTLVANFTTPNATQAEVTAARTAYDALSTQAKTLGTVPTDYAALQTEEAKLAAAGVIAMIADLPATITLADKADVVAARTAYNNLLAAQAAQVTNYAILTAAEAAITALEAAVADVATAKTALTTAIFDGVNKITLPADTADVTYTVTLGTLPTFTTGSVTLGGTTPESVVVVKDAAAFTFDVTVTITATDDLGTTNADESTIKDTKVFTVTVPNTVAPITIAVK